MSGVLSGGLFFLFFYDYHGRSARRHYHPLSRFPTLEVLSNTRKERPEHSINVITAERYHVRFSIIHNSILRLATYNRDSKEEDANLLSQMYIIGTLIHKFHRLDCHYVLRESDSAGRN